MTKKELFEALKNVDDNAIILFGKNNHSNNVATDIYKKDGEVTEIIITNNFVTLEKPIFSEKIYAEDTKED